VKFSFSQKRTSEETSEAHCIN